jgi:hypothetical protein
LQNYDTKTIAAIVFSAVGTALACAAALGPWLTVSFLGNTMSRSIFCATLNGVTTCATPPDQHAAAGAMLLIGFIFGFFHVSILSSFPIPPSSLI